MTDSKSNFNESQRFSIIIGNYCDSLSQFAIYLMKPTSDCTDVIKKKYIKNASFDQYVVHVEKNNHVLRMVALKIKDIIITLNKLFISKSMDELINFIDSLRTFLMFMLAEHVFERINENKRNLHNIYKNDDQLMVRINKVKNLLFRMLDLSIGITTLFVPALQPIIHPIIVILEENVDNRIKRTISARRSDNKNLDNVIKQLLDIELRSQILLSFDMTRIFDNMFNNDTNSIIFTIENLQNKYIELIHTNLNLEDEITTYKNTKKNLISRFLTIIGA